MVDEKKLQLILKLLEVEISIRYDDQSPFTDSQLKILAKEIYNQFLLGGSVDST